MLKPIRGVFVVAVTLFLAAGQTHAKTAPDAFRERVMDAASHCYAAYYQLSQGRDYNRSDDAELREAARSQAAGTMWLFNTYAAAYTEESQKEALVSAMRTIAAQGYDDDGLIDFCSYCDDKLNDLIDEAEREGYTE